MSEMTLEERAVIEKAMAWRVASRSAMPISAAVELLKESIDALVASRVRFNYFGDKVQSIDSGHIAKAVDEVWAAKIAAALNAAEGAET